MGLSLISGPANAGKVALLLERYRAALPREPVLIVPNRSDVERCERELLASAGCLLGGSIGTFDDLFEQIARGNGAHRPVVSEPQRALLLRRVVAHASLDGLGASARFGGFAEALGSALEEVAAGLLEPDDLAGELGALYRAYREELDARGLWDRDLERAHAARRVASDLAAWDGRPVFAYGFEDLTGAQWALLRALAGRAEVTVSLPYEPARPAFASLAQTADDLARLADGRIEELPPAYVAFAPPALAHLERALFSDRPPGPAPPIDAAIRFFEGAGGRGSLELVAEEVLDLLRAGVPADEIAVVCPSAERVRAALETALGALCVPYALEGRLALRQTPLGQALLSLLRFAWLGGRRRDLYRYLRSPYSGLARNHVDYLEGRLRGRAVDAPESVEEQTVRLRGAPVPQLDALRAATAPLQAVRELVHAMLRAAHGLEAPPTGEAAVLDLRAHEAVARLARELDGWAGEREDVLHALERAELPARRPEPGRVAVLDLLRARTRRFGYVFVLGLEEGTLPRRSQGSPFLDDERRRELRLVRPDPVARERYLFYAACTRASQRLYLVREAATDDGAPRQAGPFWDEVRSLFPTEDAARWTRRRPLSALVWPLERAPSERERLRSLAALAARDRDGARAVARANGWERRLDRAEGAFRRRTRLTHPLVLEDLRSRGTFGVTELETFADCSSMWLVDRVVSPRSIDAEVDARLRGQVAHSALFKFFSGLPKRLGTDTLHAEQVEEAVRFLRECLDEALQGQVRLELTDVQRRELEQGLWRDLEQFVRDEAESPSPLVPRRFEVSFGNERSSYGGLDLGGFALSGKIDRIDLDPFSARGIVQDYKSGKTAHSAAKIDSELRLQIPLYMLVLRDLVGIEPLGGVYRALAGERQARGLLRAEARADGVPGFMDRDYLDEDAFWGQVEKAKERAAGFVARIRAGDVRHDPRGESCPSWCELFPMCRVRRQ